MKVTVECDAKISDKCKGVYITEYRNAKLCLSNNDNKIVCRSCSNVMKGKAKEISEEQKAINRNKYYEENKEKLLAYRREMNKTERYKEHYRKYARNNREEINARRREKYKDEEYREHKLAINRESYHRNSEEFMKKYKYRLQNDIQFALTRRLRSRLSNIMRRKHKTGSFIKDLGCSIDEFKVHIENQFVEGMSWENRDEWHLDHIIPLASFDLTNRQEFLQACHYTNIQPLWATENLSKGVKIL